MSGASSAGGDGRFKCGRCEESFDRLEDRDMHERIDEHCHKCGKSGTRYCGYCKAEDEADAENDSIFWH